jgi:hypothetical protein
MQVTTTVDLTEVQLATKTLERVAQALAASLKNAAPNEARRLSDEFRELQPGLPPGISVMIDRVLAQLD